MDCSKQFASKGSITVCVVLLVCLGGPRSESNPLRGDSKCFRHLVSCLMDKPCVSKGPKPADSVTPLTRGSPPKDMDPYPPGLGGCGWFTCLSPKDRKNEGYPFGDMKMDQNWRCKRSNGRIWATELQDLGCPLKSKASNLCFTLSHV